ncbi:LUC7-domain-containing protein [Tilletiaria anomala UBC 951]|uniref:LUC7-domain-containing protein n=1 Tax=Tilletiaria anomala (strain ATCC 24038 / CBS 436.72 / UBC 951) TaxID=1037660 RepID=A0A066WLG7_TILAU|nr:LUC7-domain-containing protein [Tilletiaria anomala UBC 951]KDN53433.1 LUC7-domain-containing protein [Tilletiaria anomala UBC 951]
MGRKAEIQRIMLEKLMGPEAMGTATENLHFTDVKVCKNFLCGVCPHDLFSNTKVDLGPCPKSHNPRLKDEYNAALAKKERYPTFELEHEQNVISFMADIDRKIAANKRRLDQTPEETAKFSNLMREIGEVESAVQAAMAEVERLGEEGEVEASLQELAKAEALKEEKAQKERELQQLNESAGASGHQKLRVCDVCGAYLSILDSDRRLADHFGGKMHLGYLKLRQMITEFEQKRADGTGPAAAIAAGIGTSLPNAAGGPGAGNGYHLNQNSVGSYVPNGRPPLAGGIGLSGAPTGPRDRYDDRERDWDRSMRSDPRDRDRDQERRRYDERDGYRDRRADDYRRDDREREFRKRSRSPAAAAEDGARSMRRRGMDE